MDKINQKRLQEEIIFLIRQFDRYADMSLVDRNNFIIHTLENLLVEAKKMQTQESLLNDGHLLSCT